MTDSKPQVLVTGASGLLSGLTVKNLKHKYEWRNTAHAADFLGWVPQQSVDDHEIADKGGWHQVKMFHGEK
jgi:hypothetical protein